MHGKFITFEGAEGSGKSTQARLVYEYLHSLRLPVLSIREPGGVAISEAVRAILLDENNKKMGAECEVLLYMAARAQLVKEVVLPALRQGKIILCDRFLDSTIAYQGFGNGTPIAEIKRIGRFATKGATPDLTIVFDIDARVGLERRGTKRDRIEQRSLVYHRAVRRGYLALAQAEPRRIKVVEVKKKSPQEVNREVQKHIDRVLGSR